MVYSLWHMNVLLSVLPSVLLNVLPNVLLNVLPNVLLYSSERS